MKNNHLTDENIILYINNRSEITAEALNRVDVHINLDKCELCKSRMEELTVLNNLFKRHMNAAPVDSIERFCPYEEKILDFIDKKLNEPEKEDFYSHLEECDSCREIVGILISTGALDLLNHSHSKAEKAEPCLWEEIKNNIISLKKALSFSPGNSKDSFFSPEVSYAGTAFRGGSDETRDMIKAIEVSLPEDCGSIKLMSDGAAGGSKLTLIPVSGPVSRMLIEIYDENNTLLKSIDGNNLVTCNVQRGKYRILINERFEITVDMEIPF